MAQEILALREQLKSSPMDWDLRLSLADALARDGLAQQAAIVVSSAPSEPSQAGHLARAARHVLELDSELAIRYTNAALAQDETHGEAALTRAEAHQRRGEAAEARRFFVVATALDPALAARATDLKQWLAEHKQEVVNPGPRPASQPAPPASAPGKPEGTRLISHATPAPRAGNAPAPPPRQPQPSARPPVAIAQLAPPVVETAAHEEEVPSALPAHEEEALTAVAAHEEPAPAAVVHLDEDEPAIEEAAPVAVLAVHPAEGSASAPSEAPALRVAPSDEEHLPALSAAVPPNIPAQRRLLAQKLSAASVAILVHVALFFLLGVFVILVPEPKVAEIVGIMAPEAVQEMPETKQVIPSAMPSPSVASASLSRAITATGVSSVALPEFDSRGTLDAVPEIATTDLGASFATPFSPKGTSAVNFFGIKSKGRRVAFLIDAERYMLTDPRGGYPAYQIVKEEIAGMIGKLGLETFFNVILYEGARVSAFSDKLIPATKANKAQITDWLYPVNRDFEKLGLASINYKNNPVTSEIEPVKNEHLSGYLRAVQFAMECDVDAIFCISSGFRSMTYPRPKEEVEKLLKEMKWTEKDDIANREAVAKAQAWLAKENAARKAKGIPERVIVGWGEIWRDMGLSPIPRQRPNWLPITAEMREDQVKNAMKVLYTAQAKTKPQINFVIFIGKDQDEDSVPYVEHFENIAQRSKSGKVRVLQGLAALKNVTGRQ